MNTGGQGSSFRVFHGINVYNQPISLELQKHASVTSIIVKKETSDYGFAHYLLSAVMSSIVLYLIFSHLQISILHLLCLYLPVIAYWTTSKVFEVTEECIQVMDFIYGFQYTVVRASGLREKVFIHSQRVILEEILTMQRVRVHISCLKGPQDQIRSHNRNQFQVLPLFKHLHPKQELMQMIYNFLQQAFHHRNNQVKKSNGSFLSNGSSFKNDKVSTVTTSLNHNHVLRKRNSLNQI